MEVDRTQGDWQQFATVGTGWDPNQVRAVIVDLTRQIEGLELQIEAAEAKGAARAAEVASGFRGDIVAGAENEADEIKRRALDEAQRIRARASESGREIILGAKREALDMMEHARADADRIVEAITNQESALWERVQTLQTVVRRTESLLREVADREYERAAPAAAEGNGRPKGFETAVAAEQARVERRLQAGRTGNTAALPESVERLLTALRAGAQPPED